MTIASTLNRQDMSTSFGDERQQADMDIRIASSMGLLDQHAAFCSDAELTLGTLRQGKRRQSLRKVHDVHVERSGRLQWYSADFHASHAV